ncbi:MAG: hypothetical protein HYT80_06815 [Euryarchaeota archaeon]|nr:hypothetical protein [Euryarchaeota archaeon]
MTRRALALERQVLVLLCTGALAILGLPTVAADDPHEPEATGDPHDEGETGDPHPEGTTGDPHEEGATGDPHTEGTDGDPHQAATGEEPCPEGSTDPTCEPCEADCEPGCEEPACPHEISCRGQFVGGKVRGNVNGEPNPTAPPPNLEEIAFSLYASVFADLGQAKVSCDSQGSQHDVLDAALGGASCENTLVIGTEGEAGTLIPEAKAYGGCETV